MRVVSWNDEMSVGVEIIDSQHKKLLEVINDLHEALGLGRGGDVTDALFQELSEYITEHFGNEEQLMREHLYPELENHRRAHEGFTARVVKLKDEAKAQPGKVSQEALSFLWEWLIQHDVLIDKKLGSFLNERGVR